MINFNSRLNLAIRNASRAHQGQYRKGSNTPYIAHPFAVALITQRYIDDEDTFIAALLHDVLEDVPSWEYSRDDILRDFGHDVLSIVEDVSEPALDAPVLAAWTERKNFYINHLSHSHNTKSAIVSISDKIHNMTEILRDYSECGEGVWNNFNVDKGREIWFFEEVFGVVRTKDVPPQAIDDYAELLRRLKRLDDQ